MSGNRLFLDTNIVIYLLSGDDVLASFFNGRSLYLSYITELELLSYSSITTEDENRINDFLKDCSLRF
jgi:predicted nucleic acid-binding protein